MSYEHRSNVGNRRGTKPLKVISIIIIILLALYLFAPNFLPNLTSKIAGPFWKIGKADPVSFSQEYENALIDELRKENESLKSLLDRGATTTPTLAYILKKPPFTAYDTFVIDIGKRVGVVVGEKVYGVHEVLIGEIAEVSDSTSKVKLYSSFGEKYEAVLDVGTSSEGVQVTATGRGGGSFEIVIPRDMEVKIGDVVTVPNLQTNVFGIVKEIVADDAKTFSTILFSQPINIYELKWVELYRQ